MSLVVPIIALSMITFLFMFMLNRPKDTTGRRLPGPNGWPIVGSALDINVGNMSEKLGNFAKTYGSVFGIKIFNMNVVCLNSADTIRKAFGENPYQSVMSDRGILFYSKKFLNAGNSLSFARKGNSSLHTDLRKALVKALHVYGDGRNDFEDKVQKELDRLLMVMDELDGKAFVFEETIKLSLSNLISVLLSGKEIEEQHASIFWDFDKGNDFFLNPIVNALLLTFPFLVYFPGRCRKFYVELAAAKEKIKRKYVDEQMETYDPGKIRGIVDSLIAQQMAERKTGQAESLNYERIVNLTLETIAAGILTTLSSLCNLMICLLHHPEYQEKICQELDAVVGSRRPKISDRANCPLTEAVVMETMRYITTTPSLIPHECGSDTEFQGYNIVKGSSIIGNVDFVHHDENVWGDPWSYRPERFLDDHGQLLPRGHIFMKSWLPFGFGRRQCPGEPLARSRLFMYVAAMFQRYRFEPVDGNLRPCDPRQKDHFQVNVNVRPKPFLCRAIRRTD